MNILCIPCGGLDCPSWCFKTTFDEEVSNDISAPRSAAASSHDDGGACLLFSSILLLLVLAILLLIIWLKGRSVSV